MQDVEQVREATGYPVNFPNNEGVSRFEAFQGNSELWAWANAGTIFRIDFSDSSLFQCIQLQCGVLVKCGHSGVSNFHFLKSLEIQNAGRFFWPPGQKTGLWPTVEPAVQGSPCTQASRGTARLVHEMRQGSACAIRQTSRGTGTACIVQAGALHSSQHPRPPRVGSAAPVGRGCRFVGAAHRPHSGRPGHCTTCSRDGAGHCITHA